MPPAPGEEHLKQEHPKKIYLKWLPWINQWDSMRGGPDEGFQLLHLWDNGNMKDQQAYRTHVYQTIKHAWIKTYNKTVLRGK